MKFKGSSRISRFHHLRLNERQELVGKRLNANSETILGEALPLSLADQMIENAIGVFGLPLGIATNFTINGIDTLVPMAIEEPSVVAGASNAARMAREGTGFIADADPALMIAQIEILNASKGAEARIREATIELFALANETQCELVSLGGGARELTVRQRVGTTRRMVVHLVVDCLDAMGANIVNTMAEAISGKIADLACGTSGLRILTNLADRRLARARCEIPFEALRRKGFAGDEVAHGIVRAAEFAAADPYRAATHNKGIFNGIDAVLIATGNDWRAVEAGGHAYAAKKGKYKPLSIWKAESGMLVGSIELPLPVGTRGGAARVHPLAKFCIDLMGIESARELATVVASVGLASNLAALAALSAEGIQEGHMRLHVKKLNNLRSS